MQQVGVRAGGRQACDEAVLKHVGAEVGIFADGDARRGGLAVALVQHTVIPAQKAAHLVGTVGSQRYTDFPADAVSTKIFSQNFISLPRQSSVVCNTPIHDASVSK